MTNSKFKLNLLDNMVTGSADFHLQIQISHQQGGPMRLKSLRVTHWSNCLL